MSGTLACKIADKVDSTAALGDSLWALYPVANVVFVLYDYGFSQLIAVYISRVQRAVR